MEQIVEFREPKIKWSLYDEHNLHEIEERLFNVSYTPSDDVQKIVNYRVKRDIKPPRPLKFHQREYVNTRLSTDVLALRERVKRRTVYQEFLKHKDCFTVFNGMQIPREADLSTNIAFDYLHRHPSPIFSSLNSTCRCLGNKVWPNLLTIPIYHKLVESLEKLQLELDDKSFSLVDFDFYYVLRLRKFYSFTSHMTDTAMIKFVMLLLLQLKDLGVGFEKLITLIDRIQRCVDGKPVKMCPGIIVCAPPGTGKSHFVESTGHFMLDTDIFDHHTLDRKPQIIRDLVSSGFSIVTNRWEYKEFSQWAICVLVCFDEARRISSYGSQGIFAAFKEMADERRKRLSQITFKYTRRRVCPIPVEDWETHLNEGLATLPFIILKQDEVFADAMVKIYQAIAA